MLKQINRLFLILLIVVITLLFGCGGAKIYEEQNSLITYDYSYPNPIANVGRIYPYHRFEGYSDKGVLKEWKMVVLENQYIKLWVTPEIGGKIWGAIEKKSGKEFIYFNKEVKFRDVAMRGAWTSGGIEINFGVIGHSPTCSTPVDYYTAKNSDGSVSCFIGATDLPSDSRWSVEIRLGSDDGFFTTNATWHNRSVLSQPYYHWMNVGVKTAGNLEYVYPGINHLGHDGLVHPWPNDKKGREISWYDKNDFSGYKSFHVFGELTDFFGGYYHDDDFGFGHYADYDDKPGKKIWIWGLSRHGMIWEDLLTDSSGQYTEIQSGRLFNQAIASSTKTPFKHRNFAPGQSDSFKEYWFPINKTAGLKYGTPMGSLNVSKEGDICTINFSPNKTIDGNIRVIAGEVEIYSQKVKGVVLQTEIFTFKTKTAISNLAFYINNELLYNGDRKSLELDRPTQMPEDYKWDSVEGLVSSGVDWKNQRFPVYAKEKFEKAISLNPNSIIALTQLSAMEYKNFNFEKAYELSKKVLSIDTYYPEANMIYGASALKLGKESDGIDGFSIASGSSKYRVAAYCQLAKIFISRGELSRAVKYLDKAELSGGHLGEIDAMRAVLFRLNGKNRKAVDFIEERLITDPLNHLLRSEHALLLDSQRLLNKYNYSINGELAYQTKIDNLLFYLSLNRVNDANYLISVNDSNPLLLLYKAKISLKLGKEKLSKMIIEKALNLDPSFVFPYRYETMEILSKAVDFNNSWKLKYYLGLAYQNSGNSERALELFKLCEKRPNFYPFYLNYYKLAGDSDLIDEKDADFILSLSDEWLNYQEVVKLLNLAKKEKKAFLVLSEAMKLYPDNYSLGLDYAQALNRAGKFRECLTLLKRLNVLPNEGAVAGRTLWRETHLLLAFKLWKSGNYNEIIPILEDAKKWPENLGVGRPYDVDERVEDYFLMLTYRALRDKTNEVKQRGKIVEFGKNLPEDILSNSSEVLSALLLKRGRDYTSANKILNRFKSKNSSAKNYRWAEAFYNRRFSTASTILQEADKVIVPLPYEIPDIDRDFEFVVRLMGLY